MPLVYGVRTGDLGFVSCCALGKVSCSAGEADKFPCVSQLWMAVQPKNEVFFLQMDTSAVSDTEAGHRCRLGAAFAQVNLAS